LSLVSKPANQQTSKPANQQTSKPAAREHSFLKVLGRRITNQRGYCDIPGFMRTQILPLTGRRPET